MAYKGVLNKGYRYKPIKTKRLVLIKPDLKYKLDYFNYLSDSCSFLATPAFMGFTNLSTRNITLVVTNSAGEVTSDTVSIYIYTYPWDIWKSSNVIAPYHTELQ